MFTPVTSCWLLLSVLSQTSRPSTENSTRIPPVLKAAFLQRANFQTARLEVRMHRDEPDWATEIRNFDFQFANDTLKCTDQGDDDGFMFTQPKTGETLFGAPGACNPAEHILDLSSQSRWLHRGGSVYFVSTPENDWVDFVDIRTVGLRAIEIQHATPVKYLEYIRSLGDWKMEHQSKGFVKVTARGEPLEDGSRYAYEWEVDTEKGPAVLSAKQRLVDRNGRCACEAESRNTLELIDHIWWPREVVITSSTAGTRIQYEFKSIEFNRKDHPVRLDADSLGIPIGAEVVQKGIPGRHYYAGNGQTVDQATWDATKSQYDLMPLKQFLTEMRSRDPGAYPIWWQSRDSFCGIQGVEFHPDQWEIYVRRWIVVRSTEGIAIGAGPVTQVQRRSAQGILDDCRKKAMPIRTRLDKEISKVRSQITEAEANLGNAIDKDRADCNKRVADLRSQLARIDQSPEIEHIFDELKGRLNGLLTTKQTTPGKIVTHRMRPPTAIPATTRSPTVAP